MNHAIRNSDNVSLKIAEELDRAQAAARLQEFPGDQHVIVRYNEYHHSEDKWVYDRADTDKAKVVWAGDMGDFENAELVRYLPHRRVWLAEPDLARPRLSPYPLLPDQQRLLSAPDDRTSGHALYHPESAKLTGKVVRQ